MSFPANQLYCVLDYETRSEADIKEVGGYEYARHPSTEIMCAAIRVGTREELRTRPTKALRILHGHGKAVLKQILEDPRFVIIAHNAFFEQVITKFVFGVDVPVERWICTAALARAYTFPGKLEKCAPAMRLAYEKDMAGHRLMLKMSQPRKPTKKNPAKWHYTEEDYNRLVEYCARDIDVETEIFCTLPPLISEERETWILDQKINWRGLKVDRPFIARALEIIEEENRLYAAELKELTGGAIESTNQRDKVLQLVGPVIPDLTAASVEEALTRTDLPPKSRRILEIRQAQGKTSVAKFPVFEARTRTDGFARDNLTYHGAGPGRWSSGGLQTQNMTKPEEGLDIMAAIRDVMTCDLDVLRMLYGNPLDLLSSLVRPTIIAEEDYLLAGGDFNAIEARVLFWMAKHEEGLQMFRDGVDLYIDMAARIFGIPRDKVTKVQRQLGKKAILGLGYQMGWGKFIDSCATDPYNPQEISEELSQATVALYREIHHPVPTMWSNMEKASIAAVRKPGTAYTINRVRWVMRGQHLYAQLPSGRSICYPFASVRMETNRFGILQPKLRYWGMNAYTRKWEEEGTYGGKLTENVVQGTARDFMVASMKRLEATGRYFVINTVHDEVLSKFRKGTGSEEEYERIMSVVPSWGDGCPIRVGCFTHERYIKS